MRATLLFTCVLLVTYALGASGLFVSSASTSWAGLGGSEWVTVSGSGFTQYAFVGCEWNNYAAERSVIVDDNTVRCLLPKLELSQLTDTSLPFTTTFSIFFDGIRATRKIVSSEFTFGPRIDAFTPHRGFVQGGELFQITGKGFTGFQTVKVYFDDIECPQAFDKYGRRVDYLQDDGTIVCAAPAGEFNQDAIITVVFDDNMLWSLNPAGVYHYGPVFTEINPPCGFLYGGSVITLYGEGLDDPIIGGAAFPQSGPVVEVHAGSPETRYFGINPSYSIVDGGIVFTTPNLGSQTTFGAVTTISVFFKQVQSRVSVALPFFYGPFVQGITPSQLHAGGGDSITVRGCGFASFTPANISLLLGTTELCNRGSFAGSDNDTLEIFSNDDELGLDTIVCQSVAQSCTTGTAAVSVQYSGLDFTTATTSQIAGLVRVGPSVDVASMSPLRGARLGGTVVSIHGTGFHQRGDFVTGDADWTVTVSLSNTNLTTAVTLPSVTATIESDSVLSFVTPIGLFGLDVNVQFAFGSAVCNGRPASTPRFHYGPQCSGVSPANGWLSGDQRVTINGEGFTEDGTEYADLEVQFCLRRLNPGSNVALNCTTWEPVDPSSGDHLLGLSFENTAFEVVTPSIRQNVLTRVGGNRLFGDVADVFVRFRAPSSAAYGDNPRRDFNKELLVPGLSDAIIRCSTFTFGPKAEGISKSYGPNGPNKPGFPGTELSISGTGFDDPSYNLQPTVVSFDTLLGTEALTTISSTVFTRTTAGGVSGSKPVVRVGVNSCNTTESSFTITWGPSILGMTGATGNNLYGVKPQGSVITIVGEGFGEFQATQKSRCVIGGTPVAATITSDTTLTCTTPLMTFGTSASVAVEFGTVCTSTGPIDWRNLVSSTITLHVQPKIDTIAPLFGPTSGGTTVTFTGVGFTGWNSVRCFFGHYSPTTVATVVSNTEVRCPTPLLRAELNTDVVAHLQFLDTSANVYDDRQKVAASTKFHYGPVCTDITPSSGPTTGVTGVSLIGSGFRDCATPSDPRTCIFRRYQVEMVDPTTGRVTVLTSASNDTLDAGNSDSALKFNLPAVKQCAYRPSLQLRILDGTVSGGDAQRVVQCGSNGRTYDFHYGPLYTSKSSTFYDGTTDLSFGWEGDEITLTGANFVDTQLNSVGSSVSCVFRNESLQTSFSTATIVNTNTIKCNVPEGYWDSFADVSLEWNDGVVECADVKAGKFHYGPVLRTSAPAHGKVAGSEIITISGFGFGCCGITAAACAFPGAFTTPVSTSLATNEVQCRVPANNRIDLQLNNIGLRFTSPRFPRVVAQQFTLARTQTNTALSYYYGPRVTNITPTFATLSGRGETITIVGKGFADPYFTDAFCDYLAVMPDGTHKLIGVVKLDITEKTDTTLKCRIPHFSHECGAIDVVRPRWRRDNNQDGGFRVDQGLYYWKTVAPAVSMASAAFESDAGSLVDSLPTTQQLKFGPRFQSISSQRSLSTGGSTLTVTTTNLRDYVSPTANGDFGRGQLLCLFGSRRSQSLVALSPDQNNVATDTTFVCTTPPAPIGTTAKLSILPNPNENADTTLTNAFQWSPHATSYSRSHGLSTGYETVAVRGGGFCAFSVVRCVFGSTQAVQSDITNDHTVTCITPEHVPGKVPVTLEFCISNDCLNPLVVHVLEDFTFIGITNIAPHEGPMCGNTVVTISGAGFFYYESIQCEFDSQVTLASVVDDSTVVCRTPDRSSHSNVYDDKAFCGRVRLLGNRRNRITPILSAKDFTFAYPEITSIEPASVDIDDLPALITVRGDYFNGGRVDGSFTCKFGDIVTAGSLVPANHDDPLPKILCVSPSSTDLLVGDYDLEIKFSCVDTDDYTFNHLTFSVTQNTNVLDFIPRSSNELGGTLITVKGDDFSGGSLYLCSFGDIASGSNIIVQGQYIGGTPRPAPPQIAVSVVEDSKRQVRATQGIDDSIVCKSPFHRLEDSNLHVDLAVSIDGGRTWAYARDRFLYENILEFDDSGICPNESSDSAATSLVAPSSIVMLLIAVISCILTQYLS